MLDRFRGPRFLTAAVLMALLPACYGQTNVLTYHNDNARTGQNLAEATLRPASVKTDAFGKLFTVPVDGKVDAQPLYVSGITIPGNGEYNVVYVATEHDSVYAFNARNGRIFWHVSLLGPEETPSDNRFCGQVIPEIGITSTPVIDLTAGPHGTIYAVAMSKDSTGNYFHRLHALDLTTGAEQFDGPRVIQATYPSSGPQSKNGQVVFDAKQYKERPGLLLLNGIVYTSWGSHCDIAPYTGWIIGYDRLTLNQTSVFNLAPNGKDAALWNSGGAPAADSDGNIFAAAANGTFDSTLDSRGFPSSADFGNAFLKLTLSGNTLTPTDYWTMYDSNRESGYDTDLGSGGMMLLPDQTDFNGVVRHLAVGGGKNSNLYVIDRDNMGKYNSTSDATIYQKLAGALAGGIYGTPAYFQNHVYFGPAGNAMLSFEISEAKLALSSTTPHGFRYPGVTPSISANQFWGGIVWGVENSSPAVLHAYDALNLSTELYNSNQAASGRDQFGAASKFGVPTVANGQVFVGTTDSVAVFGLLPKLPIQNGVYRIGSQMSTLLLEDPDSSAASGTQIIQSGSIGGWNQWWIFTSKGAGYYTIRNLSSGLYLGDPGGSKTNGAELEQLTEDGSDSQLWLPIITESGYVIQNKASGLMIEDPGYSFQIGTGLQLSAATGGGNQVWVIEPN